MVKPEAVLELNGVHFRPPDGKLPGIRVGAHYELYDIPLLSKWLVTHNGSALYETFLTHYDPEEREGRGVYYTPEPVVSYIVCSLHALLKAKFNRTDGLASENVTLLDPTIPL